MNKNQQERFVIDLASAVVEKITEKIKNGEVTEDWDGMELREYMALCFVRQAGKMGKSRKKAFNNTIEVTNL